MSDICLILEGTYPYRVGGVSTWTQVLITGLPEYTFSVVHLYAGPEPRDERFARPDNLLQVKRMALSEGLNADDWPARLAARVEEVPAAGAVHALSTGFAGLLGAAVTQRRPAPPLLLSEHGIYWHEIARGGAEVECGLRLLGRSVTGENPCAARTRWVQRFKQYARHAYAAAEAITAVCPSGQDKQQSVGADPARCHLIPNGVPVPDPPPPASGAAAPLRIGLVGRIVSLKDIKTFIRACRRVKASRPEARFYVIGPTDDDPVYFRECVRMVEELSVTDFTFTGPANAQAWYRRLDIVALTSISEAQPLALLEAMACRCPVVATDVGSCRDLVEGSGDPFGPAGLLCAARDDAGIADALLDLAADPARRRTFGRAGRKRVRARYAQAAFIDAYRRLYDAHVPVSQPTETNPPIPT